MNKQQLINKLIPADDLYWYEDEQEYKAISKEQLDEIIITCVHQGMSDVEDISKVVNWANLVNVGNILLKNFIYGNIKITDFSDKDEPYFGANK
jgi:hypothetical protein